MRHSNLRRLWNLLNTVIDEECSLLSSHKIVTKLLLTYKSNANDMLFFIIFTGYIWRNAHDSNDETA